MYHICNNEQPPPIPLNCSPDLKDFLEKCL